MKQKKIFYIWLIASFMVLSWWLYCFGLDSEISRTLRNESQIYLIIGMSILSFPIGILYMYLFGFMIYGLNKLNIDLHQYELLEAVILWSGFVLIGYVQWFILLPFIWKKSDRRNELRK